MSPDDRLSLMMLYAAGALDADEAEQARAWLASGDPAAVSAYAEAQAVLAKLPEALAPVEVPASAKETLRRRLLAEGNAAAPPRLTQASVAGTPAKRTQTNAWTRALPWLAAAAALALAAGSTWALLSSEVDQARERATALQTRLDQLTVTLRATEARADAAQQILRALEAPTTRAIAMTGTDAQPSATARLIYDPAQKTTVLLARSLQPLPEGQTFQLWVVTADERKVSIGTFTPSADGTATFATTLPADPGPVTLAAITNEPSAGSPQPTGSFQMLGQFN